MTRSPKPEPILELTGVGKSFGRTRVLDDVTLRIAPGDSLGLVGESGSGKTTIARIAAGMILPTEGFVRIGGRPIEHIRRTERGRLVGMVFQEAGSSLNPRRTVGRSIAEPLARLLGLEGRDLDERLGELVDRIGLDRKLLDRYPHELSGGQVQRAAIARTLAPRPRLVVLDEPTSALDVRVQARLIATLRRLRKDLGVAYLFVSHDLPVVEAVSDRVAVIEQGRIVEEGAIGDVLSRPSHRYTRALLDAVPVPGERRILGKSREQ